MKIIIDSFDRVSEDRAIIMLAILSKEGFIVDKVIARYYLKEDGGKCFYYVQTDFGKSTLNEIDFEYINTATQNLIKWEKDYYNSRGQE